MEPDRVVIGDDGSTYGCVLMKDFLSALAGMVRRNETGFENHRRMYSWGWKARRMRRFEGECAVSAYSEDVVRRDGCGC